MIMDELPAWSYLRPHLSLWQVRRAWVLYKGTMLAIETMPSENFKEIIYSVFPDPRASVRDILKQDRVDILDKWYVLLRTTNGVYPLKLFYLEKETK